jgi:PAS domain S-box-containing protein
MNENPVKILLVDDDEDDFIIARDLLFQTDRNRYRIEWVDSYESGLESLRRNEHDLCLLDYRLGKRTGLELLREARTFHGRMPVILLTGQGDREVDLEAMKAGAADYLVKVRLTADALERAIRYAIGRKQAEESLRRERDLISRIVATMPGGIIMTDGRGEITFANAQAEQVLGLTDEAGNNGACNVLDWSFTDPEGNPLPASSTPLQQVLKPGLPARSARCVMTDARGWRMTLSINATPLTNESGKVDGMVATVEDITGRLSLEAQLLQAQKMESLGRLAAGVAHDINNVLTVILGHARLMLMDVPPGSRTEEPLQMISEAAERAAKFIKQLLMFTRKQIVKLRLLDLNAVLLNLTDMLKRLLGDDVVVETRYAPGRPCIEADTGMIEQVLMNLAVNARDAMPKGGRLQIAISLVNLGETNPSQHPEARPGRFVCLQVADTGCGMDRKTLAHLFEPFFSTKEVGRGTGLGLATVYGIIKQHRGWIEVESQVGTGTTFKIYFPLVAWPADSPAGLDAEPEAIRGGKELILLVEDEPKLRALALEILHKYGYRVLEASSGRDALRTWIEQDKKIDLLLTDIMMPGGMDGYELAAQLSKCQPGLKILYTSGYNAVVDGDKSRRYDAPFLPKPYEPTQLAQMVRQALDSPFECDPKPAST